MAGRVRPEELWARAHVECTLECDVIDHDDGSAPGMYDFTIRYRNGRVGALEVTAAADPDAIELWNVMNGGTGRWIEEGLAGGWAAVMTSTARAKRLRAELPALLRTLEAKGVRDVRAGSHRMGANERYMRDLGICHLFQSGTDFPGSIYPTIDQGDMAGFVSEHGNDLPAWLSEWVASPSQEHNLAKLDRAAADERHLFVLLPGFTCAPFNVVDLLVRTDAPVPTDDPTLPEPLTDVWIMSTWTDGRGFRWSQATGWQPFRKLLDVQV